MRPVAVHRYCLLRLPGAGSWAPVLLLLALSLALASCQPTISPDVVATSDLGEITQAELEARIVALPEEQRRPAEGQSREQWKRRLVERMVVEQVLEAEAEELELAASPEGQSRLQAAVEPLLVDEIESRRIAANVNVTDDQLRAFYDSHPEEFGHGRQIRLRHIFRRTDRNATAAQRQEVRLVMEDLHRQLSEGGNFEELAKAYSQSETAHLGGLIGRLNPGDLAPALEQFLWQLQEGQISGVVDTPVGFHIFRLDNHIAEFHMPFEEAQGRLRRRFTREGTEATLAAYFDELMAASGAVYQPQLLGSDDPEAALFALGEERLLADAWQRRIDALPFDTQRTAPPEEQLREYVSARLYLWEADRLDLRQEPAIAERLAAEKSRVGINLARTKHRRAIIDAFEPDVLRAQYERDKNRLQTPRLFHLRILTADFPPEIEKEGWYPIYEKLAALAVEIRAGRQEFAAVAKQISTDISAARGGDVGLIRLDSFARWAGPRAQKEVLEVGVGQVSDPILIERYIQADLDYERAGYMLVEVVEIRESRIRSFDEAQESVIERHVEQGAAELDRQIRDGILGGVNLVVYEQNL